MSACCCVDGLLVGNALVVVHHRVDVDLNLEMLDPGSGVSPDLVDVVGAHDCRAPTALRITGVISHFESVDTFGRTTCLPD